jgi:hypothetical protein
MILRIIVLIKGGDYVTVREYLLNLDSWTEVIVKQHPIQRIDSSCNLVERQRGKRDFLISSNQNYLEYEVKTITVDQSITQIICKANPKQEYETIAALYSGRM